MTGPSPDPIASPPPAPSSPARTGEGGRPRRRGLGIAQKISGALALAMGVLALTLWVGFDRFGLFQDRFSEIARRHLPALLAASALDQETIRLLALTPDVLHPRGEYLFSSLKDLVQGAAAEALSLAEQARVEHAAAGEAATLADRYRYLADNLLLLVNLGEGQQNLRIRMERLYRRLGGLQLELVEADAGEATGWRIAMLRPVTRLFAVRESTHAELIRREQEAFVQEIAVAGAALEKLPEPLRENAGLIYAEVLGYGQGDEGLFALRARDAEMAREIAHRLDEGKLAIGALLETTRALHKGARQAALDEEAAIQRGLNQIGISLEILAIFGLLAFAAIHLFVRRSVIHRILDLQQAIHANVDGRPRPVPVQGNDELTQMALEVNYFIEEIDRRETTLKTVAAQAAEANRAKGDFLANISHEIRTPMNAILNLTTLSLQGTLEPRERGLLEKVERSSGFLLDLINELLDFARIDSGQIELETVPFQLQELTDALEIYAEEAVRKGLAFRLEVAAGTPPALEGDPLRIQQVLRNLVGNAIKFTRMGGVEIGVQAMRREGDRVWIEFSVKDSGIGIEAGQLERIFDPFSQADSSTTRLFGGSGLGLAISLRLARQMGGTLEVKSATGLGSLFLLRLPLRECAPDAVLQERRLQLRDFPQQRLQPLRGRLVLLVEDNEFNQVVALELLERAHMEVDLATDGEEAVEMARQEAYDLILMDIQMPRMDGYQASRLIRGLPGRGHIPILALSANALPETLGRCREAGMNDLVTKPIVPARLYEGMIHWLGDDDADATEATGTRPEAAPQTPTPPPDPLDLAPLFASHYRTFGLSLRAAQQQNDLPTATRLAHNLKGAAGTIQATRLHQLANQLEEDLAQTTDQGWPEALIERTLKELDLVVRRIDQ
jgi:signal transduction histidine kinase/HPt (histidine-containing phosphotransfer) domain-containing protein/BarA-like signal transduction histidine kinase